jgi:hypothetical protein
MRDVAPAPPSSAGWFWHRWSAFFAIPPLYAMFRAIERLRPAARPREARAEEVHPKENCSRRTRRIESSRRHKMLLCCRTSIAGAVLLGTVLAFPAQSRAFDLTGAWASQSDLCNLVFAKKGGQIDFAELSDLYGSGFIADGKRIRGKSAQCTIQSQKQDGNNLEIAAACATSIMNQNLNFNLRIIDDDNIDRMFEEIPGMTLRYSRCRF